ncbi:MAG: hypothetical protein BRC40_12730 [Cyanobacteria bacterium QH_8_48_120]|nr:MAG: hypothetical protein BRC34_05865 [Cyanobacteria bacterium QH_1_48_107]PSO70892.1 MAG: hypothetical protein BRC40_12730 [Cyanobacteria bacterium QH_8_48_120]PSO94349.1 MAG: hypothetical protein BRC53_12815 [Cyanobacteria bacterium SW_6_48_11]PSP05601.1 MAG: hypothetical protein BRC54_09280 [Cyanobacteria bacterium SW_7_48_12]
MSSQKDFNLWNYKPWWCQPWSILLTGVLIISGSWLLFQTAWVTLLVSLAVVVWWTYFLVLLPRLLNSSGMLESENSPPRDFSQEGRSK